MTSWSDYLSTSLRIKAETSADIEGEDAHIDKPVQSAHTGFYGGERVHLAVGVNYLGHTGFFDGHRLAFEVVAPVYENLHGPQMSQDITYTLGYQKAMQMELIKLQHWVEATGAKILIICEGRDSAGKGGVIKRITQRLNPRVARVVALPKPSEREQTQWYFQRYVPHLPAGGEIVLFDRSWYNRAGVERVMGFAKEDQVEQFFRDVPEFERMLVRSGILVLKYWFSISDEEQQMRFLMRIHDPMKQWKLSPIDLESRIRWEHFCRSSTQ